MDRFEATRSPPPTSALLQDLLREKRATQNSPLAPTPVSVSSTERPTKHRTESSGSRDRNTLPSKMGLREMDDYINKIKKENIDLKFELFHRRQRSEAMEAKMEKMKVLEDNIKAINEKLIRDIEMRNAAIQEAVGQIVDLEAKIESLQFRGLHNNVAIQSPNTASADLNSDVAERTPVQAAIGSRSHRAEPSSQIATQNEDIAFPSTPSPQDEDMADGLPERVKSPWRTPSFLREKNENTQVLRSLYQVDRNNPLLNPSVFSLSPPGSLYTVDDESDEEDPDRFMPNSPRLSILSESSFFSVYGKPKKVQAESPTKIDTIYDGSLEGEEHVSQDRHPQDRIQNEAEIHKWIDDKNKEASPARKPQKEVTIDKYSSIDEVLEKAPVHSREKRTGQSPQPKQARNLSRKTGRGFPRNGEEDYSRQDSEVFFRNNDGDTLRQKSHDVTPSYGAPMFNQSVLPPTPDTMSTDHRDTDISTPNIITERSLADRASFRPEKLRYDMPAYHHTEKATRPQLNNYATDIMFNGYDDFRPNQVIQPARTVSYPSPTEGKRRRSVQFPPPGSEATELSHVRNTSASPPKQTGRRYDTPTPQPAPSSSHPPESRLPQSSSMRIKNMFFGRSSSQAAPPSAPPSADPPADAMPARPESRNISHPRRPSSIHLANTSKPLPDPNGPVKLGRSASAKLKDGLRGIQMRR